MKRLAVYTVTVFSLWTAVEPVLAQEETVGTSSVSAEDVKPAGLNDLGLRLNPQLGVSSFEYSGAEGGSAKQKLSGGLTVELGQSSRKLETGLMLVQAGRTLVDEQVTSSYLTIPMMAKIRAIQTRAQNWYAKFGFAPAFELNSSRDSQTKNIDILGTIGVGGRLLFTQRADFILEATYNRGLLDQSTAEEKNFNQGFLVLAGMSFKI